jgi:hypothetical protein
VLNVSAAVSSDFDEPFFDSLVRGLAELPTNLRDYYAFRLQHIKASVTHEHIGLKDPETGETYFRPVWPVVHERLLGALAHLRVRESLYCALRASDQQPAFAPPFSNEFRPTS